MKTISPVLLALADRFAAMAPCDLPSRCHRDACRHYLAANPRADEGCVLSLVEARKDLGLGGMTLEETAARIGLERSRVGVIEKQALAKARRRLPNLRAA